ncbi:MAG: response regulator [Herminiimonas sp.]|nr:response regulator [Herminiimonas sp.]
MHMQSYPFAVRLLGFAEEDAAMFDARFDEWPGKKYMRLLSGNLQDPDLYIANGENLKAVVDLADLKPSDIRPALLIGAPAVTLPYAFLIKPLSWGLVFETLDKMIESRADALSKLAASGMVAVPERRRRNRVDIDLTDPDDYKQMRTMAPEAGGVLVVDKNPAFRANLADLLLRYNLPVAWVSDEVRAVDVCEKQPISLVMINTSTPGIDPFRLASVLRDTTCARKTVVVLLVSAPFSFDVDKAQRCGVDGYLLKPLAGSHLFAVLKKFLPGLK